MKNKVPDIDKELIKSPNHFPVVGVGASAGGLDAFKKLLKAIPEESGMAFVLVQHLDPNHESLLVELLQKVTTLPVLEIADDIKVQPNHIYILPSNKMMIANDGVLELSPRPAKNKNERNLPIDLFFTSLTEVHQSHAIGVVLSGTASDGTMGLKAIKEHGGLTFAQDQASAAYEGMPHSAAEAGVVDFILPPDKIPQKILEIINIFKGKDVEVLPQQDENVFKQILTLLRIRKGTDFTYYKQSTIRRRILRRMAINKIEELLVYLKYLIEKKTEQDLLYQDLLIPVTDFFRDPKIFESLCKSVFPIIIKNKKEGEPIRIWVAGCSTGEEVYSFAICFKELLGDRFLDDGHQRVQIFATDISEPAIVKARNGIYSKSDLLGLSEAHLKEFFTINNGGYQVKKSIRDLCVFAQHNFLKDPAFSKMDFISCRNVLIYMEPYLQKKALTTFHYALNPKGFLLLGKSETTSGVPEHFALYQLEGTTKTDKIFTRKDIPGRFVPTASLRSEKNFDINIDIKSEAIRTDFQKTADDIILSKYTPAGVVVNEALDIVHFRGSTGNFLEPSPGKASLNLLKMAKDGLAFELRNILHKAKKENATVLKENIPILINNMQHNISIEAMPLPNIIEPHYLVLFHNQSFTHNNKLPTSIKKSTAASKSMIAAKDLRIQQLEKELAQSREDMRIITEDQEAANEELKSANEELLSGSEELQSLNEEMETSKEELQSTNEELTVVNQEMIGLNELVTSARDYAEAIISSLHEPLLVLDKDLRVKSANNAFYKTFQVSEKDTECKLIFDLGNKQWNIPELREKLQNILLHEVKFENFEVAHNFPNIGERVVLLNARELINETGGEKLILLAVADITEQKNAHKKVEVTEQRYHNLVYNSPYMIAIFKGKDTIIEIANDAIIETWGKGKDIFGKSLFEVLPEAAEQGFDKLIQNVYETGEPFNAYEKPITLLRNGKEQLMHYNFIYQAQRNLAGEIEGVAILANEVTPQVEAKIKIIESEERFRSLADNVPLHIFIIEPTEEANISYWNKNWLDYTGQTIEEALGRTWEGIIHPDDVQPVMEVYIPSFEARKPYYLPAIRIKRFDGIYRWFAVQANPRYLSNGEFMGYIGVGFDINEKKLAEEALQQSEAHFRLMADLMPSKISNANPDGSITYFNKQWLEFSGYNFEDLKDFGYHQIMHPDEIEEFQTRFQHAAITLTDLVMEMRFKNRAGDFIWHLNIATPIKDKNGKLKMWVGSTTEIQHQKKQREELEKAVAEGTIELKVANESLKDKNRSLQNMNKELEAFAYISSHDLQEPLRKIQMIAGRILDSENQNLSESGKNHFAILQKAAERMRILIIDLLAFSRLNATDIIFEKTNLKNIIEEVMSEFDDVIIEKNATIKIINTCEISTIPFQFRQLMNNLIGNALKFSNPTIAPQIIINSEILSSNSYDLPGNLAGNKICHITVSDNGIGFEKKFNDKIFEVFQRLHNKENYSGTGIGLAIVKKIVDNHNGIITATSELTKGATFDIYIPINQN